jgi:hypothetical protein
LEGVSAEGKRTARYEEKDHLKVYLRYMSKFVNYTFLY